MALAASDAVEIKKEIDASIIVVEDHGSVVKTELDQAQHVQPQKPAALVHKKPTKRLSEEELDIARKLSFSAALDRSDEGEVDDHKVQIVIRIRPLPPPLKPTSTSSTTTATNAADTDECFRVVSETSLIAQPPKMSASYRSTGTATSFHFTRIFHHRTQQQALFESTTKPVIQAAFAGKNGLVFAYGVTNSGKTYTITGTDESPGVLPRALKYVMEELGRRKENDESPVTKITVSYLEIYNENVYDLLSAPVRKRRALRLQDCEGRIQVRGMMEKQIKSLKDAEELLAMGTKNKQVAETNCNMDSSRSHCIFSLYFYTQVNHRSSPTLRSKVSIVDLAGSERGAKTGATGLRIQEASKINGSLMNLMRCLETMRWNQQHPPALHKMVPYRESKLTRLFQENLNGKKPGPVVMIVAVNPSSHEFDETLRTLKYSAMARELVQVQKTSSRNAASNAMYYDLDGRLRKRRRTSHEAESTQAENQTESIVRESFGHYMKRDPTQARASGRPPLRAARARPIPDPSEPIQPSEAATANANAAVAIMQQELEKHRQRTVELEAENEELRVQLSQTNAEKLQMEVQIRAEIGNEMREQLQHIKAQYREMYQRQQDGTTTSNPSSVSQVDFEKERAEWQAERTTLQQKISQLQEQLGECEDEIKRIQGRHQRELKRTTRSGAAAAVAVAVVSRRSSDEHETEEEESVQMEPGSL